MKPRLLSGEAGFTLIELLIAVALGAVILFVASNLMMSTSSSTTDLQARSELLEESQIAENYLASQIREAIYVFPVGTTLTLAAGSGATTYNAVSRGAIWTVGVANAPILAFIRPPSLVGTCTDLNPRACYAFMAYYPVLRSTWIAGTTGANDPGTDSLNQDRWMLIEYRKNYKESTLPNPPFLKLRDLLAVPLDGRARLLLDYVQPPSLALTGTPPLFQVNDLTQPPVPAWTQAPGNISVNINLAVSRQVAGKVVTVPSRNAAATAADSVTTITVTPRNLGTLPLN